MGARHASGSIVASSSKIIPIKRDSAFDFPDDDPKKHFHNGRGFVMAIMMSVACWAGVGLAFLM